MGVIKMPALSKVLVASFILIIFLGSCNQGPRPQEDPKGQTWEQILDSSKGRTVTLFMWEGDPYINKYMNNYIAPNVRKKYGIHLRFAPAQGNDIISMLMKEQEARKRISNMDMVWINGETFYQLRQLDGLFGPFTGQLPNSKFIDYKNPYIKYDFQQQINGYECPWGNVQFTLIYNSDKVHSPPKTMAELEAFVKANPGRFTIGNDFTGMTFLKSLLIDFAGGRGSLNGKFDSLKYKRYSSKLWEYINHIKLDFWKKGETFPDNVAAMHQLFSNGELYITMSNNDAEVDNKVLQGLFPTTTRAYVLDHGTIQNSHYMGIIGTSGNKGAAMVVCNYLLSPEAQFEKFKPEVWGDGTVLDIERLPVDYMSRFMNLPERKYSPVRSTIQDKALQEPAAEYMVRLFADFRKYVIEKK